MPKDSLSDNLPSLYKWATDLKASIEDETELKFQEVWEANDERLPIKAVLVDTTVNRNKWRVPEEEIDNIINQVRAGIPIKLNHSKDEVRDIVGKFDGAEKDKDGDITQVISSGFLNDRAIAKKVWDGTARKVSIDGLARKHLCRECNASMLGRKVCKCGNDEKDVTEWDVKEGSIVDEPAYENTEILPFQFSAALDKKYNEQIVSPDNDELEASQMDDEDKKKMEAMEKELKEYKAKCKAMEEDDKKKKEEAKAAEEEEKKKKDEEAKAALEKELNEQKAKNEELEAKLRQNAGVSGGAPDDQKFGETGDVISELSAHLDKTGEKNPFSMQG